MTKNEYTRMRPRDVIWVRYTFANFDKLGIWKGL